MQGKSMLPHKHKQEKVPTIPRKLDIRAPGAIVVTYHARQRDFKIPLALDTIGSDREMCRRICETKQHEEKKEAKDHDDLL
jgi:hypothetical protein